MQKCLVAPNRFPVDEKCPNWTVSDVNAAAHQNQNSEMPSAPIEVGAQAPSKPASACRRVTAYIQSATTFPTEFPIRRSVTAHQKSVPRPVKIGNCRPHSIFDRVHMHKMCHLACPSVMRDCSPQRNIRARRRATSCPACSMSGTCRYSAGLMNLSVIRSDSPIAANFDRSKSPDA